MELPSNTTNDKGYALAPTSEQSHKICVRRSGALGDVILLTPVIRELHRRRPDSKIFIATHYPQVFDNSPWVTACIPSHSADPYFFDEFIDLDGAYENTPSIHVIEAYAQKTFSENIESRRLELFRQVSHKATAEYLLRGTNDDPYIVLHIRRHHWPNRNLPQEFWLSVVNGLLKNWHGHLVQIGDENDGFLEGHPRLINLTGKTSLPVTTEILAGARCFLGVDTATLHMAACTDTPIVSVFTCVRHEFRQPFREKSPFIAITPDIDCYGCQANYPPPVTDYRCARGDAACVYKIKPESALNAVLSLCAPEKNPAPSEQQRHCAQNH